MFFKSLCLLSLFSSFAVSQKFRYDYSYSQEAGGWLKLHRVPATWNDAQLLCHAEGAMLASPLTRRLQEEMVKQASAVSIHTIFTGVHTIFTKGVYASIEGVPLAKLPISWAPGEPDNFANSESCLAMQTALNGTMIDVKCNDVFPFICYKKTQPLVLTGCGTHGYNFNSNTGSCYKFHRYGQTWAGGYRTCMAEDGYLLIINSEVEAQVLREIYAQNLESAIFSNEPFISLGLYYNNGEGGNWMTIHGQTPTEAGYDNWESGEPNNATQPMGELCGITHRSNGRFYDGRCDRIMAFICEKAPTSFDGNSDDERFQQL